jgi:hypothetical protein
MKNNSKKFFKSSFDSSYPSSSTNSSFNSGMNGSSSYQSGNMMGNSVMKRNSNSLRKSKNWLRDLAGWLGGKKPKVVYPNEKMFDSRLNSWYGREFLDSPSPGRSTSQRSVSEAREAYDPARAAEAERSGQSYVENLQRLHQLQNPGKPMPGYMSPYPSQNRSKAEEQALKEKEIANLKRKSQRKPLKSPYPKPAPSAAPAPIKISPYANIYGKPKNISSQAYNVPVNRIPSRHPFLTQGDMDMAGSWLAGNPANKIRNKTQLLRDKVNTDAASYKPPWGQMQVPLHTDINFNPRNSSLPEAEVMSLYQDYLEEIARTGAPNRFTKKRAVNKRMAKRADGPNKNKYFK